MKSRVFYFRTMKFSTLFILCCMVLISCRKDPSTTSGTSSIRYESENYIDLRTNFAAFVNTTTVEVENANPWQDILGQVMTDASQSTIDGKPVSVSNLEITNVRASSIELYCGYDFDDLQQYLDGGSVLLKYLDASGSMVSMSLGTLGSFNASEKKAYFTSNSTDLTSFIKNKPDHLTFDLQLSGLPPSEIDVKYSISFDYNYSYEIAKTK